MTSSNAGAVLEGGIELHAIGKGPPFPGTTEAERRAPDNHQQNLSFSDVLPADITVRNLEVEVGVATSPADTLMAKFTAPEVDVEAGVVRRVRKKILKDISTNFPAGTLTAIIGGSGSGKVCVRFRSPLLGWVICLTPYSNRQPFSMLSPVVRGDLTLPSPEVPATMDLPIFLPSPVPTSHRPMCYSHP